MVPAKITGVTEETKAAFIGDITKKLSSTKYTTTLDESKDKVVGGVLESTFSYTPEKAKQEQETPRDKTQTGFDWRARLRPKDGGKNIFYGSGENSLMTLIKQSNGLIWQYTPSVTMSAAAEYHPAHMQGMNYSINTYNKSSVESLQVLGDFTANDIYEAQYMLAAMHFLKICTKSYFGEAAVAQGRYGTPPPVMLFEYLGDHLFNKVPVVVTNYTVQFEEGVDYVPVVWGDTTTYVPTKAQFSVTLLPTYNPTKLRTRFDLEKLKSGEAYKDGFI